MSWNIKSTFSNQEVPTYRPQWSADTVRESFETPANSSVTLISCLTPGILKPKVTGVIIHKGDLRSFISKKDHTEKYVLDISIRDSPEDFITVSCWGHFEYINDIDKNYQIGHTVIIDNVAVQSKPLDGTYDKYKPSTPGMYVLSLFESRGVMSHFQDDALGDLAHIPVKTTNDYYTIFDINSNKPSANAPLINILSIVKEVGPVKEFTDKKGKHCRRCEVILFDDTAPQLILTIWNEGCIQQSQHWKAKETVIFGADLRPYYNTFKNRVTLCTTSKSILTQDPECREAFLLSRYARTVDFDCPTLNEHSDVILDDEALNSVSERMSVLQVKSHMQNNDAELYCVVWAYLTSLPIDQQVLQRCPNCHKVLTETSRTCSCQVTTDNQAKSSPFYNLRASLTDSTGSLKHCVLPSCVVEKMLDMQVETFTEQNQASKVCLKWKFLLERCKVVIQVGNSSDWLRKVRILSVSLLASDPDFNQFMSPI